MRETRLEGVSLFTSQKKENLSGLYTSSGVKDLGDSQGNDSLYCLTEHEDTRYDLYNGQKSCYATDTTITGASCIAIVSPQESSIFGRQNKRGVEIECRSMHRSMPLN